MVTEPSDGVISLKRRKVTIGSLIAIVALCVAIGAAALSAHGRMRAAATEVMHDHEQRLLDVAHPPASHALDELTRELREQRSKLESISLDLAGIRQTLTSLTLRRR